MNKLYEVRLSGEERDRLSGLIMRGTATARALGHARILLKADTSPAGAQLSDRAIAEAVEVSVPTVERVRKRYVEEGLESALGHRPPRRTRPRRLYGEEEAHLVALACSSPPDGQARWTLRLLADKLVALEIVEAVSHETVRTTLKKTNLSLGKSNNG